MSFAITHISTACIMLEVGTKRILTDPVFDPAGRYKLDCLGLTRAEKDHGPAIAIGDIGPIDVLLLSHHQHADNLDEAGKVFIGGDDRPARIIATRHARKHHPEVTDVLAPGETTTVGDIMITATPALHAPPPYSWIEPRDHVVGWILEWPGQIHGAVYISGDTVLFPGVRDLINKYRGKISVAILHMGGVRFWLDFYRGLWTFDSKQASEVCSELGARTVVPIHYSGWTHLKEQDRSSYASAFEHRGIADRLVWLDPGKRVEIDV